MGYMEESLEIPPLFQTLDALSSSKSAKVLSVKKIKNIYIMNYGHIIIITLLIKRNEQQIQFYCTYTCVNDLCSL